MSEKLKDELGFDVLGDVLATLRFRGSVFFRSQLAAPWGVEIPEMGVPRFHIALEGECYVGSSDQEPVKIEANEIVMLPAGKAHWLADKPGRKLTAGKMAMEACRLGDPLFQDGEITNSVMCGIVQFDQQSTHPILASLPDVVHFPMLKTDEPIWMTVSLMNSEIKRLNNIDDPIIDRLTEVLFLQLLYRYSENSGSATGFLAALKDRRLCQALTLIHEKTEYNWTLQELGQRVGMSRTTLVRHFEESLGCTPGVYMRNWRMTKAYSLVKHSSTPFEQVAAQVGFSSARALAKTFYRQFNKKPGEVRRDK